MSKHLVSAATLRTAIGNWKYLDLLVAASACDAKEWNGRPLNSNDIQCHALRLKGTSLTGFYASLLDYDFGTDDCLMSIGTGHLGWSEDKAMVQQLLF